ncbi:hypothetical protein C8039_02215 [Halogeometricum sp. wsp3]|nr:hypothetical protein C8039_02215 [Halogeometricum sp. wsp3]
MIPGRISHTRTDAAFDAHLVRRDSCTPRRIRANSGDSGDTPDAEAEPGRSLRFRRTLSDGDSAAASAA